MNNEKYVRKIVMKQLPQFWFYVVFSFIFAFLIQLIGLIPPILMQKIIDDYIPNKKVADTLITILWFSLLPVLVTLMSTFYNYKLTVSGRKMGQKLSIIGFEKLIYQPISYFDDKNSSELASYCKGEAMKYIVFWIFDIPQLFASILNGVVVFVLVFRINIYIALGTLLYFPILVFPSNYFAKRVQNLVKRIVENNAKTSQIINDTFKGIKFIKAMVIEKTQIKKMQTINNDTVSIWSKTAALENLNGTWTNSFVDNLFTGVVFGVSAILIINGSMSLGNLIIILNYIPKIFSVIKTISNTNFRFKQQLAEYDKLFDIIAMEDERIRFYGKIHFKFNYQIIFKNVSFAYIPERGNILNKMNLKINKNEWLGIVGSSGAGKTTIFDLLLSLYDNYTGEIFFDDINLNNINIDELRKNITKVSQDTFLFPGTLKDNLLLVKPEATDKELCKVIEDVQLTSFMNTLEKGLDTYIGENGIQLSGGQKQRIGLAQGLLRESKILLLDEVTANIDTISENKIKKIIRNLISCKDLTVITISHRLEFLDNTDRIVVIDNGKVVDEGVYNEIKKRNTLFIH